jgi:hypothetical protein
VIYEKIDYFFRAKAYVLHVPSAPLAQVAHCGCHSVYGDAINGNEP